MWYAGEAATEPVIYIKVNFGTSRGTGAQVNPADCGFDSHSRKQNI